MFPSTKQGRQRVRLSSLGLSEFRVNFEETQLPERVHDAIFMLLYYLGCFSPVFACFCSFREFKAHFSLRHSLFQTTKTNVVEIHSLAKVYFSSSKGVLLLINARYVESLISIYNLRLNQQKLHCKLHQNDCTCYWNTL